MDGVVEAGAGVVQDLSLDELLLRVHEEVLDALAPLPVLLQLVSDFARAPD